MTNYLTLRRNRTTLLILFAPHSTCQKWPGWGYPLLMITEPAIKRAVTFADGQNLFYAVREAFGYTYPNYDVLALSRTICRSHGWHLSDVYFYTGIPDSVDNPSWHHFWSAKLRSMSRQGIHVFSRPTAISEPNCQTTQREYSYLPRRARKGC